MRATAIIYMPFSIQYNSIAYVNPQRNDMYSRIMQHIQNIHLYCKTNVRECYSTTIMVSVNEEHIYYTLQTGATGSFRMSV